MRVAVLLPLGALAAGQGLPVPRFDDPQRRAKLEGALPGVEKVFERYWKARGSPGLIYGVVIDGEIAAMKSFGVRDRTANDAVTPDTVFRIASMTKSFTALAVLKLRDEGRLSLDDPVSKWIPEVAKIALPTRDSPPWTVRQLLTHGTGLPEDNPWGDQQLGVSEQTLTAWLKLGLPFSTAPDTEYEYSNYGFALAGRVVARASGMSYRDYLEKRILAPLGMQAATLEPASAPAARRATGYRRTGEVYSEEPPLPHGAFGAMGGLLTSARDLGRYVAYMLSAFPARDEDDPGPVRRSSLREMQRVWRRSSFTAQGASAEAPMRVVAGGYGYGLSVSEDCRFERIVGHGGGLPGFGSYMMWLPEYGVGMFAMANLTYTGPSGPMHEAWDVFSAAGGLAPRRLPAAPVLVSVRDAIARLVNRWDDQEAEALAADNLYKDTPKARRREQLEKIRAGIGACRAPGGVEAENWLRGRFVIPCEKSDVEVTFTLAPAMPAKVQYLRIQDLKPGDPDRRRPPRCRGGR
jgi:CubicO group peptidase (beta-lactamase class C family)